MPSILRHVLSSLTLLALFVPHAAEATALTFEERVECHRAVAAVYESHREGGAGRAEIGAVPNDLLPRRQAEEAILASAALEDLWSRPLTAERIQAEVERIGSSTRRPEMLAEIIHALGDDPTRFAECVARPLLAERELRSWYARDERLHADTRQRAADALRSVASAEGLRWIAPDYREIEVSGPGAADFAKSFLPGRQRAVRRWEEAARLLVRAFGHPAGTGRGRLPAVAAGSVAPLLEEDTRFLAVGLLERSADSLRLGIAVWPKRPFEQWWTESRRELPLALPATEEGSYRLPARSAGACVDDSWSPTIAPPVAREHHSMVWTGTELIAWGGQPFPDDRGAYGNRYDPATDTWKLISEWQAPESRDNYSAVWTGSEMIVWGGRSTGLAETDTGGRYDPATDSWTPTSTIGAPTARQLHSAVWTGEEMIVWGGCTDSLCDVLPTDGGRYDPATDTWSPTALSDAPAGRYLQSAVWTGEEMIVWGGWTGAATTSDGGRYDPAADRWSPTTTAAAPTPRFGHSAVWDGSRMIVWGGREGEFSTVYFDTGGLYDPQTDTWATTSAVGTPVARDSHVAVWTGSEMIVWGGFDGSDRIATGGRYDPAGDHWTPTTAVNEPSGRAALAAAWTGNEMLVFGGNGVNGETLADGGRYDPAADSWAPMTLPATPYERDSGSQIWTGTELVVWGGCGGLVDCPTDTGGRYDPLTDVWTPTSTVGAASRREFQNSEWTGTELLVWGGCADAFCFVRLGDGGRYDPAADSWSPMSTSGAPTARYWHAGAWTGSRMMVWGGCENKDCTNPTPPLPITGGLYDPITDSWQSTTSVGAPGGRWFPSLTTTDHGVIVWGGEDNLVGPLDSGALYDPATDSWTAVTTTGAPSRRSRQRAAWTGEEMLVWGGNDPNFDALDTGGRYDPVTDSWAPITRTGAPSPRIFPYTAWTGTELLVWGGLCLDVGTGCNSAPTDGAYYDPANDVWRPTTLVDAPTGRADLFSGPWTGQWLAVFGGQDDHLRWLRTGGFYCASGSVTDPTIFGDGFESGDASAWTTVFGQ